MFPMHVVRQLMTKHPPNILIKPKSIIFIRPYPQLDLLARIDIQSQKVRILMGCQFGQRTYGELVLLHYVLDSRVV